MTIRAVNIGTCLITGGKQYWASPGWYISCVGRCSSLKI